jgi:hypothetical protein
VKRCCVCREEKPLEAFSIHRRARDGRQNTCKACAAARQRQRYEDDKPRHRALVKARQVWLLEEVRRLKAVPCADCGGEFPAVCMDFDHLDDKVDGVSKLVHRGFSLERILEEIRKCEVVCSNCHRIRTEQRGENTARALRAV